MSSIFQISSPTVRPLLSTEVKQGDDAQVYTHNSIQGHVTMEIFGKASGKLGGVC